MCDNEGGASLEHAVHTLLQLAFRFGIHAAGGFVQDEDLRVGRHGARQSKKLLSPLGEHGPALGEHGVVAVRQRPDKAVRAHKLGRADELFVAGGKIAVAQIVHHGACKYEALLHHQPHLGTQRSQRHAGDIHAVNGHPAFGAVVKTAEQVDDGCFSAARVAHQSHALALLHMKIHMLEHKDILFIGERDVVELHIAADLRQHCGAGGVLHLDRFVDHLKDTLQICHVVDEVVVDVGKLVDGPPELGGVVHHGQQHAHGNGGLGGKDAVYDDGHRHAAADEIDNRGNGHGRHDGAVPGAFGIAQQAVVHVGVVLLPREKLGDLHAGDALVEVGVHIAAFVGVRLPPSALHGLDEQDEPDGERQPRQHDARQARVHAQHENNNEHQVEHLQEQADEPVGQDVGHRVDVVDDTHENFSVGTAVEIGEGKLLQVLVQVAPQVMDDVLADDVDAPAGQCGEQNVDGDTRQHERAAGQHHGDVPRGHGLVQHAGREQRPAQARHHGQRLQYERAQEQASLPADVHKAAPDHFPAEGAFQRFVHAEGVPFCHGQRTSFAGAFAAGASGIPCTPCSRQMSR